MYKTKNESFVVGSKILDVITTGMYSNPYMALREYIQNAADAIDERLLIDEAISNAEMHIDITVDRRNRSIKIVDNATGISPEHIKERLCSLAISDKDSKRQRGFRGIGRLGGLSYCEILRFETRDRNHKKVTVVEWDKRKLSDTEQQKLAHRSIEDAIDGIVTISTRTSNDDEKEIFFSVTLLNVNRLYGDPLMDVTNIREYIERVAPVPYDNRSGEFSYSANIDVFLRELPNYKTYNLSFNGSDLCKPFGDSFLISKDRKEEIKDIEYVRFYNEESDLIALAWFAKMKFLSSLPKSIYYRGLRVRHGNIEVGDDRFLEDIFTETRFSRWHIGEVHLGPQFRPNARRDGFEPSEELDLFIDKAKVLGIGLSKICRYSSQTRTKKLKFDNEMAKFEDKIYSSVRYISGRHKDLLLSEMEGRIAHFERIIQENEYGREYLARIENLKQRLKNLRRQKNYLENSIKSGKMKEFSKEKLISDVCVNILTANATEDPLEKIVVDVLRNYC
jgi:hypothetical protein